MFLFNPSGFEIVDQSEHGILHHADLLHCQDTGSSESIVWQCGDVQLDMECDLIVALSSGSSVTLPSEVHYPIEAGLYTVEVHLDLNPVAGHQLREFVVSGSGLRAHYSLEEREMTMGLIRMEIGEFTIPPHQEKFEISAAMHSSCTEHFLPSKGIDILFFGGHMHNLGRQIRVDRISKDRVVHTVFRIKQWDFNRQFSFNILFPFTLNTFCSFTLQVRLPCSLQSVSRRYTAISLHL